MKSNYRGFTAMNFRSHFYEFSMIRPVLRGMVVVCMVAALWLPQAVLALGHGPVNTMYTDVNYHRVRSKRLAEYQVSYHVARDTVFFETYHLHPEGMVERGFFPRLPGNDVRNCNVELYWPDGKIRAKGKRTSSFPDGPWDYYDQDGILYSRVYYSKGLMHGLAYRYFQNGDVLEIPYENGKKIGTTVRRDHKFRTLEKTSWHGEFKEGWAMAWDTLGHLIQKTLWHGDKKLIDSVFYSNGILCESEVFDSTGKYNGKCMMLNPAGKIMRLDEFSHGEVLQNMCMHPITQNDWNNGDCYPRKTEPHYPGGESKYERLVRMHQDYPDLAREWHVQGVVEFVLYIDTLGKITRAEESNLIPVGYNIEKEVQRLLRMIPHFEPLMTNGVPRASRKEMMFAFIL